MDFDFVQVVSLFQADDIDKKEKRATEQLGMITFVEVIFSVMTRNCLKCDTQNIY